MSKQGRAAEFAAWAVPPVSTPDAERVCHASVDPNRGYCGRRSATHRTRDWRMTNCADCRAAYEADQQHRRTNRR